MDFSKERATAMALNVSFLTEQWEKELYAEALYGALLWAKSLTPDKTKKHVHTSKKRQAGND